MKKLVEANDLEKILFLKKLKFKERERERSVFLFFSYRLDATFPKF